MSLARILNGHLKKVYKNDSEYFTCVMDEDDIKVWYVLVKNLDGLYKNGEYLFKLIVKDTFPDTPPSMRALTPNGVFQLDGPICTSIGEFHESDHSHSGSYGYRSALGMYGFILNSIVNGIISAKTGHHGIRFTVHDEDIRIKLAEESVAYNKEYYPFVLKKFEDLKSVTSLKVFT